jgi:uncharacterized metal-binding protein
LKHLKICRAINLERRSDLKNEAVPIDCACRIEKVIFLTCAGASNCGQIANQAAVTLDKEGLGRMYCLAGMGAHNKGMVESAKSVDRTAVIDGCPTACAKTTAEHAGLVVTDWFCVRQMGIDKVHEFNIQPEQTAVVTARIREGLSRPAVPR